MGFLRGQGRCPHPSRAPRRRTGEGAARSRCEALFPRLDVGPARLLRRLAPVALFPQEAGFPAPQSERPRWCSRRPPCPLQRESGVGGASWTPQLLPCFFPAPGCAPGPPSGLDWSASSGKPSSLTPQLHTSCPLLASLWSSTCGSYLFYP